ncbi:hypothetical protein OE88DRAFT_1729979 [Heliocybe sulcata]|uniref:F-box domain-containing protein n=1 Tax=Heliocybe sulcata TaxID=5364 RepID=A0A5C3NK32_9AGAM|nr:hypothetical protein OE88DRAFT_1729979 [Heliocybe sulcata]
MAMKGTPQKMLPDLPQWLSRNQVQRMGPSLKEQYRQQIEDEMGPLQARLLRLRADRNALAPISCLPVELLSRIFRFVVEWENEEVRIKYEQILRRSVRTVDHSRKNFYRLKWISISHVCRTWRTVAIDCPVLWKRPFYFNANLTKMMLERSRETELDVFNCSYSSFIHSDSQALQLVPQHMPHVRSLDLVAIDFTLQEFLNSCIGVPAPRLTHLSLQAYHSFRSSIRNITQCLSSDLFQRHAPNLRTLRLRGWGLDWESPLLTGLTHLELQSILPRWRTCVEDVIAALKGLPHLERLGLANAMRPLREPPMSNAIASLPRLQTLMLREEIGICVQLLEHLSIPAGIPLILSCNLAQAPSPAVPSLVQALAAHFEASCDLRPFHTMRLWMVEGRVGRAKIWRGDEEDQPDTNTPAALTLTFQQTVNLVQCALHDLPLAQVRKFAVVTAQDHFGEETWLEDDQDQDGGNETLDAGWNYLLLALKELRVLEVVGTVLRMWEVFHSLIGVVPPWECPLPSLQTIALRHAVLDAAAFEALPDMVGTRKRRRLPLPELSVQQCSVSEEWTSRARVHVYLPSYTWDDMALTVDQAFFRFHELGEWEYRPPLRLHGEDFLGEW